MVVRDHSFGRFLTSSKANKIKCIFSTVDSVHLSHVSISIPPESNQLDSSKYRRCIFALFLHSLGHCKTIPETRQDENSKRIKKTRKSKTFESLCIEFYWLWINHFTSFNRCLLKCFWLFTFHMVSFLALHSCVGAYIFQQ